MNEVSEVEVDTELTAAPSPQFDAIIIGAGIAGLHQLYRLRELGLSVRLFEAGAGVGGTWFWNRYPGARLDSESYTYGYFFSEELLNEWSWSEEFVSQPELERYFNFVADKFSLREDIQLSTRVVAAAFDSESNQWVVRSEDGVETQARYLISAVGILSTPFFPVLPGLELFEGVSLHTALWPSEPVQFEQKRVAVIGTGSSGVQLISAIGNRVKDLVVFQRTPNWCTPSNNAPISPERAQEIRNRSEEIHDICMHSPAGFQHSPSPLAAADLSPAERSAYYEERWNEPGLTMYVKNYRDVMTSKEANESVNSFIAEKIRSRVNNPEVAKRLIPTDHGYGMKRPPLEANYYEVYNQENVTLISLSEEPITEIDATSIHTSSATYEVDVIVLATGFDAFTGALSRIDIHGSTHETLLEHWSSGPETYLGIQCSGFPNFFIIGGPHSASGNFPRGEESQVEWITDCIRYLSDAGYSRIEVTAAAEDAWTSHAYDTLRGSLLENSASWAFGSNVPGKARAYLGYRGGQHNYRARLATEASSGYESSILSK